MRRQSISPNEFDEERVEGLTDFRCERCRGRYPVRLLADVASQDGRRLCIPNCANFPTRRQADIERGNADGIAADLYATTAAEAQRQLAMAPVWSELATTSFLTGIVDSLSHTYPDPVTVGINSFATATLSGTNFQPSDSITTNSPSTITITYTAPTAGDSSISITVTTFVSTVRGDYDLLFNSAIFRNAIRVR